MKTCFSCLTAVVATFVAPPQSPPLTTGVLQAGTWHPNVSVDVRYLPSNHHLAPLVDYSYHTVSKMGEQTVGVTL